jgi:type VII secretion-associated protein (TIGR03931 family)
VRPTGSAHRAVIETGPGTIRRLCCATSGVADDDISEIIGEALSAIDDRVGLVGGRPVTVDSLWRSALRAAICTDCDGLVLVHPSWWPPARVGVVTAAATTLTDDVLAHSRSWLLTRASDARREATVVIEIAERLVVITGTEPVAISRCAQTHLVVEEVADIVAGIEAAVVLVDAPSTVAGASALGTAIAVAVRRAGLAVVEIGDARLPGLARSALSVLVEPSKPRCTGTSGVFRSRTRVVLGVAGAAIVLAALLPVISAVVPGGRRGAQQVAVVQPAPTTFLVEGRVALTVPANWPAQRVITGPGSARVQVTSPSDPEVALHITQSPVVGDTLGGTAQRLKRAIEAERVGVFVDFNPTGLSAGRPAVTYREVRVGHQVRWTVWIDGPVRISIGCQSRPGDDGAVRDACEQAVRSAHAIG